MTERPAHPIKLHRHALSGHAHRVELFLSLLGLPFTLVEIASEFETTLRDTSETGAADHFYHGVQRFRALIETA